MSGAAARPTHAEVGYESQDGPRALLEWPALRLTGRSWGGRQGWALVIWSDDLRYAERVRADRELRRFLRDRLDCTIRRALGQDGPHAQPEQQQAQRAETGYPELGYQTLAEGLRRLAAGRKAPPAPLTYEQSQTRWREHMAEATRLQESLRTAPLEQVEGIRQRVHAELRECQRLTDLEQALLGEVRW